MSHQELLELYFSLGADDSLDDIMPKKHDDAAASTAPDTTTTLDKYVHVLAAADSHREHHDFPILGHNSSRLLLSEAVALFHLTQEHGDDAAAVCLFYSANDNIRFLVSKNRPCTPDEWASTRALVSAVQNAISKDELTEQLYKIFHKNCRKRISCHFCHLCEALTPRPKIGVTSEMAHALDRATASPTPHTTETAASVISSMVTSLKWASLERPRHFRELSLLCAVLAVVLDASPIQNLPLLAALSRVAAYKAAVGIISYWGFTNSFVNRRSKLSVEEVCILYWPRWEEKKKSEKSVADDLPNAFQGCAMFAASSDAGPNRGRDYGHVGPGPQPAATGWKRVRTGNAPCARMHPKVLSRRSGPHAPRAEHGDGRQSRGRGGHLQANLQALLDIHRSRRQRHPAARRYWRPPRARLSGLVTPRQCATRGRGAVFRQPEPTSRHLVPPAGEFSGKSATAFGQGDGQRGRPIRSSRHRASCGYSGITAFARSGPRYIEPSWGHAKVLLTSQKVYNAC